MRHLSFALLLLASLAALAACQGPARNEVNWAVTDIDQETELYVPRRDADAPYVVRTAHGETRVTKNSAPQAVSPQAVPAPARRPVAPAPYASPAPAYRAPSAPTAPAPRSPYGTRAAPPPPPPPPNWPGQN